MCKEILEENQNVFAETLYEEKDVYNTLANVDVKEHVEKKGQYKYLSWAYAWAYVKSKYPTATYKIYENVTPQGYQINYFTDGKTAWVKTSVTIYGIECVDMLPVMNASNKSLPLESIESFDVNKTIQRSLTKALARHGLGLSLYAGEDLPCDDKGEGTEAKSENKKIMTKESEKPLRVQLANKLTMMNIDKGEYVKEHHLSKDTTDEEYKKLLSELDEREVA